MTIVVDTSGLVVARDESHLHHERVAGILTEGDEDLLLSPFVLAEADYMLAGQFGHRAAGDLLDDVAAQAYELADFDYGDVASAKGVIDRYEDLHIGLADASLVVIAARYETTRLLTFDQRHFRAVAPLWGGPAFTLVPLDE